MRAFRILAWLIAVAVVAAGAVWLFRDAGQPAGVRTLAVGGKEILVELADTPEERALGLSGHAPLAVDAGMFFIFPVPGRYSFWMKDMLFSLDLIWIDANWRVVQVTPDVPPESYPATFQPDVPVKYVLEVNAGWAEKNNIASGAEVELQ